KLTATQHRGYRLAAWSRTVVPGEDALDPTDDSRPNIDQDRVHRVHAWRAQHGHRCTASDGQHRARRALGHSAAQCRPGLGSWTTDLKPHSGPATTIGRAALLSAVRPNWRPLQPACGVSPGTRARVATLSGTVGEWLSD